MRTSNRATSGGLAVLLAGCVTVGLAAEPVYAVDSTTTPPYDGSGKTEQCDLEASCSANVVADHRTGRLSVDLSVVGATTYTPGEACASMWPNSFECNVVDLGAYGEGRLWASQAVPRPVRAVVFTIMVEMDPATASGSAYAELRAGAMDKSGLCGDCSASVQEKVVSTPSSPSAPAATRTLTLTYRSWSGRQVPAGPVSIVVALRGDGRGPGAHEVHAAGTVTAIIAACQL